MTELCNKYSYIPDDVAIGRSMELLAGSFDDMSSKEVLKNCFAIMDLTSLGTTDSQESIRKFASKVADFHQQYPGYPYPASVCVYPNFVSTVKSVLPEGINVTAVAGCFPTSQSFPEVKQKEIELAVLAGADEIDIVLALNSFLAGNVAAAAEEIESSRRTVDEAGAKCGKKIILKVILETGLLVSSELIAEASFLAMENGADFIKTSTGKVPVNATPTAACIMCNCIKAFYEKTGRKVGFKAAGGIATAKDAVCYWSIVNSVLGKEWLCKEYFRLGVSRLANALVSEVEEKTVTFF